MIFQNFSPNMLKTYDVCSKKFYYRYIKNLSMPVNDEQFELGKNIHALASYYLKKENIDKMELSLNQQERAIWEYLKTIKYFAYECVNTEYNLSVRISEYFFGGRLDALVKQGDKYFILDYKTGVIPKNVRYDYQTMIYLLAVKAFFKTSCISFVYIDLKNKSEAIIDLTDELAKEYENKLLGVVNKIESEDFKKNSKDCKCEYNIICY